SLSSFITIAKGGSSSIFTFFNLPAGAELVLEAGKLLLPLAGAEEGSCILIPFKVLALNVDFDFKIDLIVVSPKTGSAPVSFSSGGRGCYKLNIHQLNHNQSLDSQRQQLNGQLLINTYELSVEDFTNTGSFGPELEISSVTRAIKALTLVTSLSSDDTSSSSQSYVSAIRLLFLPEDELGAEAMELMRASLALTLLYLASKSLVCLGSGLCSDEWRSFG
ncbi:hypothetical protein Tco_1309506, partial [Tanacetum coccineum]